MIAKSCGLVYRDKLVYQKDKRLETVGYAMMTHRRDVSDKEAWYYYLIGCFFFFSGGI